MRNAALLIEVSYNSQSNTLGLLLYFMLSIDILSYNDDYLLCRIRITEFKNYKEKDKLFTLLLDEKRQIQRRLKDMSPTFLLQQMTRWYKTQLSIFKHD